MTTEIQRLGRWMQWIAYPLAFFLMIIGMMSDGRPENWSRQFLPIILIWSIPLVIGTYRCSVLEYREMKRQTEEQRERIKNTKIRSGLPDEKLH